MANFDTFVNTDLNTTPFQMVVFGKKAPLLEVELNEMQCLLYNRQRTFMKDFVGDRMIGSITYDSESHEVNLNGTFCVNGYIFKCDNLKVPITKDGTYYANIILGNLSHSSTVRKYGYSDGEIIDNTILDSRIGIESTQRKSLEFSITEESDNGVALFVKSGDNVSPLIRNGSVNDEMLNNRLDFINKTTIQNEDGSISENFSDGSKVVTIESEDGKTITEKYYLSDGTVKMTKTTTEDADGNIIETVTNGGVA